MRRVVVAVTALLFVMILPLSGSGIAADIPDVVGDVFEGIADGIVDSDAIGVVRVVGFGDGDNKTMALMAHPISFNGTEMKTERGPWVLSLDYVYEPLAVVSMLTSTVEPAGMYGGVGVRASYKVGSESLFVATGICITTDEISDRNAGYYFAGGWQYSN